MKTTRLIPLFVISILLVVTTGMSPLVPWETTSHISVTTVDDQYGGINFGCSLREAIEAANTNTTFGGCPAGAHPPAVDVIYLPFGTYALDIAGKNEDGNQSGDLDISEDLIIRGAEIGTVIDAGGRDRIVDVLSGASVTLENLTLTGGRSPDGKDGASNGGGIRNAGNLTLTRIRLINNQAGKGASTDASAATGGHGGGIYTSGIS